MIRRAVRRGHDRLERPGIPPMFTFRDGDRDGDGNTLYVVEV